MNIQGLDYNTQREALLLPEYGREIQKMVDMAITLPTADERLKCAKSIVKKMETRVPSIRANADYKRTLWDHLYVMSRKQLDIEWPYDVSDAEKINAKPNAIPLPQTRVRLRHYGRLVQEMCDRLKSMAPGAERNELTRLTANQMKRDLMLWGHGSIDDEKVADDMDFMTDGVIRLDLNTLSLQKTMPAEPEGPTRKGKKKR